MNVTSRVAEIKQPGRYIKPSQFKVTSFDDGIILNEEENIAPAVAGLAVDYLTRFIKSKNKEDSFRISLLGAHVAEEYMGVKNSKSVAQELLNNINGIDDFSIICACKLVTFDVWYRNTNVALRVKDYTYTNPDKKTIYNIRVLVNRCISFLDKFGDSIIDGFRFNGGYTPTVNSGDGDYLSEDTLWDFKVSKNNPRTRDALQVLMYWIMGKHSGQEIFKNITKIGIYNPRLNNQFVIDMNTFSKEIIKAVEKDVICY